jgi:hypothetical protein
MEPLDGEPCDSVARHPGERVREGMSRCIRRRGLRTRMRLAASAPTLEHAFRRCGARWDPWQRAALWSCAAALQLAATTRRTPAPTQARGTIAGPMRVAQGGGL